MVSCFISRLVILLFGTLYPAYASYKAVRTKNVKEYVKWMMYWIVFALFTCAETFTDLFLSFWFPFYYEIKIITVIYLLSPATKGSSILYRKFVHPVLIKREQEIDEYISKAKEQGYHTMLNLGSKGVTYATSLIMQTAIKGGGGIVSQLRKSYSLGDLSEEKNLRNQERESEDDVDSIYEEEPRLIRRIPRQSPRRTASIASDADLYFSEVDSFHRPLMSSAGHYYNSQNPSLEEISSGYSSGNTVYSAEQKPRADHLVRTASLGSSRIRTRSTTKTGLPKRSSLSEGGSTMSAMESQEGQIESDKISVTSLSQSAPFFPPFFPLNNLLRPEHQYVFGRIPQNQMFAFFNPSQYFSPENNFESNFKTELGKNPSITISEIKSENGEEIINLKEKDVKQEKKLKEKENDVTENKEKKKGDNILDKVAENPKVEDSASFSERSGRYNKKSAPAPPIEGLTSIQETSRLEYEDDLEFSTPSSSPKLDKKLPDFPSCNSVMNKNESKSEDKTKIKKSGAMLQKPRNSKSKGKKVGKISKKLQLPKITFPFWQQKSSKISSGSETSSVASIEASIAKPYDTTDLEYFISLKQTDDKEIEKVSNRKSF